MNQLAKRDLPADTDHAHRVWPYATPLGISDERQAKAFLLPALREVAWEDGFPVPTKVAVEILNQLDYVVDAEALIAAVEANAIPLPKFANGGLLWSQDDLLAAATYLELRQAWKPCSVRHDVKKSRWRTLAELADAVGTPEVTERMADFDTARLLVLLTEHDCREVREGIAAVLWARLREAGAFDSEDDESADSETEGTEGGD